MRILSGLHFDAPDQILCGYLGSVYQRYDSKPVQADNELSREDVVISRSLVSRLSDGQVDAILQLQPAITDCLSAIPANIDLLDIEAGDPIPGEDAISRLVTEMCRLSGVKLAKTMKILHKKRPALLPILDSVVERHYWPAFVSSLPGRTWGDYAVALMHCFHKDLLHVGHHLRELRGLSIERGTPLSHCRILDLLIWCARTNNADYFRRRSTMG
ncbi:MAG: DUF6308 family protein [Phycisphaeraceae bacterium]